MGKQVTLTAKTNVKYGAGGETAAPGEDFTVDESAAAQLVEVGAAEPKAPAKSKDKD